MICPNCEGAGWDWKKAADEDLQVDDPVDYYPCIPCNSTGKVIMECDRSWNCQAETHIHDCLSQPVKSFCIVHGVWFIAEHGNCPTCRAYIAAGL